MKAVLSWIKDYVDLDGLTVEEIAEHLTMLGLEVEQITLVGMSKPEGEKHAFKYEGIPWAKDKFVVAEVREVNPHPNADRLVLCRLFDGTEEKIVLTGAPNLYPYKGQGALAEPLKVAYAQEGAELYDGHQNGKVLTKLKKAVIRGVESSSMICSEKELGISEEHDGVIILDSDAPTGMPLVDYMGDAVFEIDILPNMARNASMLGVARELSAVLKRELHHPVGVPLTNGEEIKQKVGLEVRNPKLNPRFMLGMLEDTQPTPSPYWVQRRLALAGMRPIDSLVDATNYTMLDVGEPLHAFDYDLLTARAAGEKPTIITRTAAPGEKLTTLDEVTHTLDDQMVLVTDTAGALSIAGVMGGSETGISSKTRDVLVEAATWNFINIRRTCSQTKMASEASYRFSRDVHPALSALGLSLCLARMQAWGGGRLVDGVLDVYPNPLEGVKVSLKEADIERVLGMTIPLVEAKEILERLGFACELEGETLTAISPDTRMDIEPGLIGKANLIEEVSRIYGYNRIPANRLAKELPPQTGSRSLQVEEAIRDILVSLGLQDTIAYRQTSPEREARRFPAGSAKPTTEYVRIKNPITPDRTVMRTSGLATMLEMVERNTRYRPGLALFEIGPVFLPVEGQLLPDEPRRVTIGMTGSWDIANWQQQKPTQMDFYALKGVVEALLHGLHVPDVRVEAADEASFHPGKCARVLSGDRPLGVFGEIHPLVKQNYDLGAAPLLVAEFDAEALVEAAELAFEIDPISNYPAVYEDIAVIVPEDLAEAAVQAAIWQAGGNLLKRVQLFDLYRGNQTGEGKKSLAYQLTYQAYDRTLSDKDAETVRNRIVRALGREFGAVLRSA